MEGKIFNTLSAEPALLPPIGIPIEVSHTVIFLKADITVKQTVLSKTDTAGRSQANKFHMFICY